MDGDVQSSEPYHEKADACGALGKLAVRFRFYALPYYSINGPFVLDHAIKRSLISTCF